MAKSTKLGGGGRFEKLKNKLMSKGKSASSAKRISASIGRKKYGNKNMGAMSAKGRARAK
jgi:hypothetical protein